MVSDNSTTDNINNESNSSTNLQIQAGDNNIPNCELEVVDVQPSSVETVVSGNDNGDHNNSTSSKESMKKSSMSSQYRLRKRRSAYLQSDSSSNNEPGEFVVNDDHFTDINSTSNSYICSGILSTNSVPHSNVMVMDNTAFGLSIIEQSDLKSESIPMLKDNTDSTVSVGVDESTNSQPLNMDSLNDKISSVELTAVMGDIIDSNKEVLYDFVEKKSKDEQNIVEYPSILRLFALQYTTFPVRVSDNRFTPISYEHKDTVKPDYKLISPFIYYYAEFTSFELSFYYQMLTLLLHSKICRVPQICMNRLCVGYQAIILHLKQCTLFKCKNVYCFSARLVLHHIVTCSKANCRFCSTLPTGVIDYCKSLLYSNNDQNNLRLVSILKSCFFAPCISARNEEYNIKHARKILNHILDEYLCIDKNSFEEQSNKALASIDRKKVVSDMVKGVNAKKIDVCAPIDNLHEDCTNFENALYRHSHSKEIYLQSVANIGQMLVFISQIMIKTEISPLEELKQIMSQTCIYGLSVKAAVLAYQTPGAFDSPLDRELLRSQYNANNAARNLSYGYENTIQFTPTRTYPPKKIGDVFLPLVQDLFSSPDGLAFQFPVDPVYFVIYDYYDIVSYPMDLQTIITRLKERFYVDPWEVIHDVWQTFQNAWLYNRRTTRVYKIATRLKDIFIEKVTPIVNTLKLCCPYRRVLTPQPLFCMGKDYCVIHRESPYYIYQNYHIYCERCFNDIPSDTVTVVVDEEEDTTTTLTNTPKIESRPSPNVTTTSLDNSGLKSNSTTKSRAVEKSAFLREVNSKVFMENFVECRKCSRRAHQICKQHTTEIDGIFYYCDDCMANMPPIPKYNHYTCERLLETHMSKFIEQRVNEMLIKKLGKQKLQFVRIRMVYNNLKKLKTSPLVNEYFVDKYPPEIPYQSKALFAFQQLGDGSEICFFGMHVQEFDNNAPEPNRGRVYLSYLDSVHFFQPKHLKTQVYFTVLSAYFEYVRRRGFSFVHLWACPPCEGDDYIFHCHPAEQRVPKHKRLVDWYRKLLDECVKCKIFTKIKDLHKYLVTEKQSQLTLIPYFEGDYWPNAFEDIINEVKMEKNPDKTVGSSVNTTGSSLRRGRAMLMQNYDKEDNEEDASTTNVDDDNNVVDEKSINCDDSGSSNPPTLIADSSTNKQTSKSTQKKRSSKSSKAQRYKRSKTSQTSKRTESSVPEFLTVEQRLFNLLERFKDVFFVCRLNNSNNYPNTTPIIQNEIDPPIRCELTDGRSGFLQLCRERKWEFSTMLRTKFTTLGFLVELHIQFGDRFIFTCNNCKCHLFNKYHCVVCPDFDLCYKCFCVYGHEHRMTQVDESYNSSNLTVFNRTNFLAAQTLSPQHLMHNEHYTSTNSTGGNNASSGNNTITPSVVHDPATSHQTEVTVSQELLDLMLHCSTCPAENTHEPCPVNPKCQRMRMAIQHCSDCHSPDRFKCAICHSLMIVCVPHARVCRAPDCPVVFCVAIRERICFNPSDNNNRPSTCEYPPNDHSIAPHVDQLQRIAQMGHQNCIHPDIGNSIHPDIGNSIHPDIGNSIHSDIGNSIQPTRVDAFHRKRLPSQPPLNSTIQRNIAFQHPSNPLFKQSLASSFRPNQHPQQLYQSQQMSCVDINNMKTMVDRCMPSTNFSSNQSVPMYNLLHNTNPTINLSNPGDNIQSQQSFPSNKGELSNMVPSQRLNIFNPLKEIFSVNGNYLSCANASNNKLKRSITEDLPDSPVSINIAPSEINFLDDIPMFIDPIYNPAIPTQDILSYNLSQLKLLLNSYETRDLNTVHILNYIRKFPYVISHLSDTHQNMILKFLRSNKSHLDLDDEEDSLFIFLHRIQVSRLIHRLQVQHRYYMGNLDSISQLVVLHSNQALKSLWSMPKQQIIDFVNSFRIMDQSNNIVKQESIKSELLATPFSLIHNTNKIAVRFSNSNSIANSSAPTVSTAPSNPSNLSDLSNHSYIASNSYGNNFNYYLKKLLLSNQKKPASIPKIDTDGEKVVSESIQNEADCEKTSNDGKHINNSSSVGDKFGKSTSPIVVTSANETALPHLATSSVDSCIASTQSSTGILSKSSDCIDNT